MTVIAVIVVIANSAVIGLAFGWFARDSSGHGCQIHLPWNCSSRNALWEVDHNIGISG